tara:strand:- start:4946 stop:5263 length:318 start_codon:yes stop_codon:yes gene_type:complete
MSYDPEAIYQDADIEMYELARSARELDARHRKADILRSVGELQESALMCPHSWGYTLDSSAAKNAGDPRQGEAGERCHYCNSVVDELCISNPAVLYACEPVWDKG